MVSCSFGDVEGERNDLAVAREVADAGVDAVNGEKLTDFPELVLAEARDGAARLGVMAGVEHPCVVEGVMLQMREFPFPLDGSAPRAGLVCDALV